MSQEREREDLPSVILSEEQRCVLDWTQGDRMFALVEAIPGAGKTRLLKAIIEQLLLRGGGAQLKICVVSYTNAVVNHTKEGLDKIANGASEVEIATIHSISGKAYGMTYRDNEGEQGGAKSERIAESRLYKKYGKKRNVWKY